MSKNRNRDLDMSDVLNDAHDMMVAEQERLDREVGPMHWVMDEYEARFEDNYEIAFQN